MVKAIKGRGWHGDASGHKMAGQKGGHATALSYGQDFYSTIGRKGGSVSGGNFARNLQRARDAGRKGGKSKGNMQSNDVII